SGPSVVLLHGNVSSSVFWEPTMAGLAGSAKVVAPDMRGFGGSEALPVDATRGLRDFSDDLHALLEALPQLKKPVHLVGWSVGGGVVMQYAIDHADTVASLTLVNPCSPFGFGGTQGSEGIPGCDDFAGSGGGTANPNFVQALAEHDRGDSSSVSPRNVLHTLYFKPPFLPTPNLDDALVDGMLATALAEGNYPGNLTTSNNWPGVAPGELGINNAFSPKYHNLSGFVDIQPRPPVLWIRGADDQIISDRSMLDFGVLGELGLVSGWPGAKAFPAQPMLAQTRHVLNAYAQSGGAFKEVVFDNCGHSPHIEQPERFLRELRRFLRHVHSQPVAPHAPPS
ncbi:MAG: alpha/beta fold hydrolase, partial [Nannocystaceae bacterium]